jgi:hypothetical protein
MDSATPSAAWRVNNLELALGEDEALLRGRAARELGFDPRELRGFRIARKALDARVRSGDAPHALGLQRRPDRGRAQAARCCRRRRRPAARKPGAREGSLRIDAPDARFCARAASLWS